MIKKLLVLSLTMLSMNALSVTEFSQVSVTTSSDCADECLNVKEFNSGEGFYIWTTGSVKFA